MANHEESNYSNSLVNEITVRSVGRERVYLLPYQKIKLRLNDTLIKVVY